MEELVAKDSSNFIEDIIREDIESKRLTHIQVRFPPEPNGYLHIGHAKSIVLNFNLAKQFGGKVNLRFDDTNPTTESQEFVDSIKHDIEWLGFGWDKCCFTSDYFEKLYAFAKILIDKGVAYVDDSSFKEINKQRGVPTYPGEDSPFRNRSIEENHSLFEGMHQGLYADETKVLRAKIDMASPNMHLRDPILYRIKRSHHHRTGDKWCIYPTYDFAHGQSDSIEQVSHSICTLEFAPHRPLYDWLIEHLEIFPSKQYEFARLNLTYCLLSKRKLLRLVNNKLVNGWDDPRMPTMSGMRKRGYTSESIRNFCQCIGIQKRDNWIDYSLLEFCVRDHLNKIAFRRMVVFDPLKVVITNFDQAVSELEAENNPENEADGHRIIPFSQEIYIEKDDFMEFPTSTKYFRLAPQKVVRLKYAYIIKCEQVIHHSDGSVKEVHCSIVPNSRSGQDTSGVKVKGTLHWVSSKHAQPIRINLYDRLFKEEYPDKEDIISSINPDSHRLVTGAMAEPSLVEKSDTHHFQFLRKGYFYLDESAGELSFNQVVKIKDSWAKMNKS